MGDSNFCVSVSDVDQLSVCDAESLPATPGWI